MPAADDCLGSAGGPRDLLRAFPALAELDPDVRTILLDAIALMPLDTGAAVFAPGQACERYLLVLDGSVRVHLLDAGGREIVLYRLVRGDACILTTAALLAKIPYATYAVAEAATVAAGIPATVFEAMMSQSAGFRRFVFAAHGSRTVDLMRVVTEVAFTRIQVRLARLLLRQVDRLGRVTMTHEAIAVEVGTAREVVSRNLKALERDGCVRLGQGVLIVLDAGRLASLAEGDS